MAARSTEVQLSGRQLTTTHPSAGPTAPWMEAVVPEPGGWLASLCVAGFTAIIVRKIVKTEMIDAEPMAKPPPFSCTELLSWSGIFLISFVAELFYPTALGTGARTCLPSLLASTVLGYIVGSGLPSDVKKVFHPIICCTLSVELAAVAFGYFSKSGLDPVLVGCLGQGERSCWFEGKLEYFDVLNTTTE